MPNNKKEPMTVQSLFQDLAPVALAAATIVCVANGKAMESTVEISNSVRAALEQAKK